MSNSIIRNGDRHSTYVARFRHICIIVTLLFNHHCRIYFINLRGYIYTRYFELFPRLANSFLYVDIVGVQVRERSSRSVPMGKMGVNRTAGTPDSLSDNESSPYSRTPVRKASTPTVRKSSGGLTGSLPASRPTSRPQSRPGSKPPSRHGSNLSLDSTGELMIKLIDRLARVSFKDNVLRNTIQLIMLVPIKVM